ncbi:acetylcholine receptor subunit alpha-like 1 [Asterias rubens]|uniref:acetylcholine receptor subunit alpha-like 1 n=1 Tax=Asterias rubens TaxID=7604 RepID=UPI0014558875|nr:acetylcholine receptor subunit alpha-like 1 [Asterias rubens]
MDLRDSDSDKKDLGHRTHTWRSESVSWVKVTLVSSASEKSVVTHLLSRYGPRNTRPLVNSSKAVHVTIRLRIDQIVEFDVSKQQLTVNGWLEMTWKDEYLVWNPDNYDGVNEIFVSESDIWIPKLKLLQNVAFEFLTMDEVELWVTSDGTVQWHAPIMCKIYCAVEVSKFPFDVQYCEASFLSWVYDSAKMNLSRFDNDDDSYNHLFSINGVWSLQKVESSQESIYYMCCEAPFSRVVYRLTLKRGSMFYVFSMIIPSVILTTISLLVFCMPPESGEKISLGITNLLAFILFQQLISGAMPPQGIVVPVVGF